jgi:hypothetical protein
MWHKLWQLIKGVARISTKWLPFAITFWCMSSEGDPSLYETFYTSLKNFIEKSLDIHKVIFKLLLLALFCVNLFGCISSVNSPWFCIRSLYTCIWNWCTTIMNDKVCSVASIIFSPNRLILNVYLYLQPLPSSRGLVLIRNGTIKST